MSGVAPALTALILVGFWGLEGLWADLLLLARAPLAAIAAGRSHDAFTQAEVLLRGLTLSLTAALLAVLVVVALVCLVVQGPAFGWPRRTQRIALAPSAPTRTGGLLWGMALCGCVALTIHESLDASLADLPRLARTCAERVLALTLPCMVIDAAFARARFHASQWLTRREQRDEQRAAQGAPELRAARARQRREVGA